MKPWNVSETPPRHLKEPMWKSFARRLRDWLESFLNEAATNSSRGKQVPDSNKSSGRNASMAANRDMGAVRLGSSRGEGGSAFQGNPFPQPGPPEDWLRRVREAAPEFLRSVEEGATPVRSASREIIRENDAPRDDALPSATSTRISAASAPMLEKRPIKSARRSSATATSRMSAWLNRLRGQLRSVSLTQGTSQTEEYSVTAAQTRWDHPSSCTSARLGTTSEATPHGRHTLQKTTTEADKPLEQETGETLGWISHWRAPARREIESALPSPEANCSVSRSHIGHKNEQRESSKEAEGSSQPTGAIVTRFDLPSARADQHLGGLQPQGHAEGMSRSGPSSQPWMALSADDETPRNQGHASAKAEVPTREKVKTEESGTADRWPFTSGHRPEFKQDDPWPELPEDRAISNSEWMEFLRNSERLSALDLEQKGGR
jgi:hypothetical protein